ncbi:DUF7341 domain-containing protein [Microbacterium enclense]|uniref:DUF7341 domain-containing protein n=1 Tax=Microbacterium enclense TaxID=993073 RepID=UPI00341D59A9
MPDLLDAVDALTLVEHEHIAQKSDDGRWLKAHTVTHPSLLQRMADAVTPSTGRDNASKSSAATRSPVDADALFEYAKMSAAIKSWCLMVKVAPDRDPAVGLRKWYVARLAQPGEDDAWYTRQLTSWANIIRNHLNPPQSFTIKAPCPICRTEGYGNAIDGGDTWPIEVRYRMQDERVTDEIARCRVCGGTWHGHDAIEELADELSQISGKIEAAPNPVVEHQEGPNPPDRLNRLEGCDAV